MALILHQHDPQESASQTTTALTNLASSHRLTILFNQISTQYSFTLLSSCPFSVSTTASSICSRAFESTLCLTLPHSSPALIAPLNCETRLLLDAILIPNLKHLQLFLIFFCGLSFCASRRTPPYTYQGLHITTNLTFTGFWRTPTRKFRRRAAETLALKW